MNRFTGSVALIRHPDDGEGSWLSVWDGRQNQFALILAERLETESFRECLDREIAWVLDLNRNRDYVLSSVARLHFEAVVHLPRPLSREVATVTEFFVADLYGKAAREKMRYEPSVTWLTSAELLAGHTRDGSRICPFTSELLRNADVIGDHRNRSQSH